MRDGSNRDARIFTCVIFTHVMLKTTAAKVDDLNATLGRAAQKDVLQGFHVSK